MTALWVPGPLSGINHPHVPTRIELDTIAALANGRTYEQIATDNALGPTAVSTRLLRCRKRLGVDTTAAAVAECIRRGLLVRAGGAAVHDPACALRRVPVCDCRRTTPVRDPDQIAIPIP